MSKHFSAEERKKIIEEYEKDSSKVPEGYYIIKNRKGVYNVRKIKDKKRPTEPVREETPVPEERTEEKKKEPKPNTL